MSIRVSRAPAIGNPQGCWNWFLPAHQQRGTGEPARIFVAGLSSGGATARILAACYPDLFTAVAIHSGLPYRSADDVASAFAAMGSAGATHTPDGHPIHAAMGEHARPSGAWSSTGPPTAQSHQETRGSSLPS